MRSVTLCITSRNVRLSFAVRVGSVPISAPRIIENNGSVKVIPRYTGVEISDRKENIQALVYCTVGLHGVKLLPQTTDWKIYHGCLIEGTKAGNKDQQRRR